MKKIVLPMLLTIAVISGFAVGSLFRQSEMEADTQILFVKSKLNFRNSETQNVQIQKQLRVSDDPAEWTSFREIKCK